ncbi:MAG: CoA transferase, partial [Rhodospirillales bacterium]|nr:CoA transferase [Rhodospirillales bacterium]
DPHFAVRDMLAEVENPGSATPVRIAGIPVHMTETPGTIRSRPPLLGEHTDSVLGGYGFTAAEIDDLRQRRIVQ